MSPAGAKDRLIILTNETRSPQPGYRFPPNSRIISDSIDDGYPISVRVANYCMEKIHPMTFWTNGTCCPTPKPSFVVGLGEFSLCIENPKYGATENFASHRGGSAPVRSNENLVVESYISKAIRPELHSLSSKLVAPLSGLSCLPC